MVDGGRAPVTLSGLSETVGADVRGAVVGLLGTTALGAHLRSRGRTGRHARRIATLDEPRLVVRELGRWELGWDIEQALSLALFRTYAVPEISVVLAATGELVDRAQRRYDDTELVMTEMVDHGLGPGDGRTALRRMNAMHAAFDLDRDDLLYVLTTFVVEPLRWVERYGWRQLTPHEVAAHVAWYVEVGRNMGIADVPDDLASLQAYNTGYESARFRPHLANREVADASVALFLGWHLPPRLRPLARPFLLALLDDEVLDACGYARPARAVRATVHAALGARAWVQRNLLPERRRPVDLTTRRRPSYPGGHVIGLVGTFPDADVRGRVADARAGLPDPPPLVVR